MGLIGRARSALAAHGGDLFVCVLIATAVLERVVFGHAAASVLLAATWGVPLLVRRRFPLLAPAGTLLLIGVSLLLFPAVAHNTAAEVLLAVAAVWLLTAHGQPRRAVWVLPLAAVVLVSSLDHLEGLLLAALLITAAAAAGFVHRRDVGKAGSLHSHVEQLARTEQASLQDAAAAERARIAREVHDIVAHSVSVMTVQAGAARLQLAHDPTLALASVEAVEEAAATALAELERLIGLLGPEAEALGGLDHVGRLVAQMRQAGLDVRLTVEGAPRPLGASLDVALYRILQEALTNALKHAGQVRTDVVLRYDQSRLCARVTNPLPARARSAEPAASPSQGHGLIGMRERVAMYGGSLEIWTRDGTFCVDLAVPT